MTDWYESKKKYIRWFGDNLIYEYGRVEFHLDTEKKNELIKQFLEQISDKFTSFENFQAFTEFILANMPTFFDNIVSKGNSIIPNGMKLSKAFKFFIEDKENLVAIQQIASSYIQQDKIKGVLCLSVHPLDYLSSSENTYNWRSCHSLDGDYRAGNLSYMTDKSTIVCYIRGDKVEKLPDFPENVTWNSKKWRMLVYFDENQHYCFLGRQYPYALDGILERMLELMPNHFRPFTDYGIKYINEIDYRFPAENIVLNTFEGMKIIPINEVIEDDGDLHYNDLLYSHFYRPYYSSMYWAGGYKKDEKPKIIVGHKVKCLCCGTSDIPPGEGMMLCLNCASKKGLKLPGEYVICDCCGEAVLRDEAIWINDGENIICEDCWQNSGEYCSCPNCGEIYSSDRLVYSHKYDEYFCQTCYDDIVDEEIAYCRAHKITEDD